MTPTEARNAAARAAAAVYSGDRKAADWLELFLKNGTSKNAVLLGLAGLVENAPTAPAEALYRLAMGAGVDLAPWRQAEPRLRAALEVFRATYLVLLTFVREAEALARAEKQAVRVRVPETMRESVFDDTAPGLGDRF